MKMPCFFFFVMAFALFSAKAASQAICGFDQLHQQRIKTDPGYSRFIANFEKTLQVKSYRGSKINTPFTDTIPVVVHIIHTGDTIGTPFNPSDLRIQKTIEYVNQVYAGTYPGITGTGDIGIRFALAKRDPTCNASNGIDRTDGSVLPLYAEQGINIDEGTGRGISIRELMKLVEWDPYRYYNIWVVNTITDKNNGDFAGFAYLPYTEGYDGLVIEAQYMQESIPVLPHEFGHAFFLYHVFEGSLDNSCPANNDCETDGDRVCDTDPVTKPGNEDRTGINPCTGTPYSPNTELNFMNYVCCRSLFTEGQKLRMQQTAVINLLRDTLSKSSGRFPVDAATACSFTLHLEGQLTQNDIRLYWKDSGNTGYTIERSYDGTVYTSIAFIQSQRTLAGYSFHDEDISQEKNYYRLRQDFSDERINYSNTILLVDFIGKKDPFLLLTNPVHDNIDLHFGIIPNLPGNILPTLKANTETILLDMSGRIITKLSQTVNRFQNLRIPVYTLPPGIYILKVFLNKNSFIKKIVKI